MNELLVGLIAGVFGMAYFVYGKKQQKYAPMISGVLLCVYPYVTDNLVWLGVILVIPLAGMGLYWLFRPKDFDPLHETERPTFLMGGPSVEYPDWILTRPPQPVAASGGRMTPALQGGADPEPEDESEPAA